ncbi:MAG: hypothetical protein HYS22_07660 [Deltaproteobacteria bacterium]|nr:hypothetical protein [Deltaproteobacteria bacterium]
MKKEADTFPAWEKLLSAQALFQSHFPESVLVGGTAAALHAGHRVSMDADHVLPDLKKRFAEILAQVEKEAGWKTSRMEPPVLILGNFQGVRTGIRQLIRKKPLETTMVKGLRVPTVAEILRIKGYLITKRNTTRDFIDFVALFDHFGAEKSLKALASLDDLYPQEGEESVLKQLATQLAEPKPWDLTETDLSHYKSLKEPYTDWNEIKRRAGAAGLRILESLLV